MSDNSGRVFSAQVEVSITQESMTAPRAIQLAKYKGMPNSRSRLQERDHARRPAPKKPGSFAACVGRRMRRADVDPWVYWVRLTDQAVKSGEIVTNQVGTFWSRNCRFVTA